MKSSFKSLILVCILCIMLLLLPPFHYFDDKFMNSASKANDAMSCMPNGNNGLEWDTPKSIPTILHQSWKTDELPVKFKRWRDTWITNHPTWIHKLWTDDGNRIFVSTHYPWFLKTFDKLKRDIHRVDTVRYMYLHKFGGVYADLDFESIRPVDVFLKGKKLVLGRMGSDNNFEHSIPNAFMASIPGHPFWIKVLEYIHEKVDDPHLGVEGITGPVMLYRVIRNLPNDPSMSITESEIFYPYSWAHNRDFTNICSAQSIGLNEVECKKKFVTNNTLAITYWSHSWDGPANTVIQS